MNNDTSLDINQESNPVQTVAQPKEDNEMLRATDKITALYCRLSVEDTKDEKKNGKEDLSNSIQNQQVYVASIRTRSIAFRTRRFSLMTATAVWTSLIALAFRKCLRKLKPVMWKR
ncbi:MAG: hypothetical protein ACLRSD_01455 [Oscillibacter sp.]